jgi:D-alanyl-D-alanine carboxypeptidase
MITALLLLGQLKPPMVQAIDEIAQEQLRAKSKGLAIAVLQGGKQIYAKGFGDNGKIRADSKFRIGSLTKQFTSGLIVILVREGKLSYSDTLGKYIPEVPNEWQSVTIHQLLNHTSGIPSYTENAKVRRMIDKPVSTDGIWQVVQTDKMNFKPGEGWQYNNSGYCLLGSIAERVTKKRYFQLLDQYLFKPVGMRNSGEERKHKPIPSFDSEGNPSSPINMDWPYAAGAIVSTVVDLGKWDAALHGNKLFTEAEKKLMFTADPVTLKFNNAYGYGWGTTYAQGEPVEVHHGGGIPGFTSFISRDLKSKQTIIVLNNNSAPGIPSKVAKQISKLLDPNQPSSEVAKAPDKTPELTAKHKGILVSILDGSIKEDVFAKEFLKNVPLATILGTRNEFTKMGALSDFRYFTESNGRRGYLFKLGASELKLWVMEDKEGKISGMLIGD